MKKIAALLLLLAVLLGGVAMYHRQGRPNPATPTLAVYCAASLQKPLEAIARQYKDETGVDIRPQFGGTGSLLSALRVAQQGDLFITADDGAVTDARQAGVIGDVLPVVIQRPVIAVRKGNPKNIRSVADLLRDDVKLALANPDAASISRVSRKALGETWEKLAAHATVMKPTVTAIASDVNLGTVDAGLVWDSTVAQFKDTEAVDAPELAGLKENASACLLIFSTQPAATLRFMHYLTAPEKGGVILKEQGFTAAGGKPWTP